MLPQPPKKVSLLYFITPTLIAHKFWQAERKGDWLLQQQSLEEMLPYFFAASHH